MPIDPKNPPNYVSNPNAAIPVYVAGGNVVTKLIAGDNIVLNPSTGVGDVTISAASGAGSAISYYLNGGTASTPSGYYQMSSTAVNGTGADFSTGTNGVIASFITSANYPNATAIPAGNWTFEFYFDASSAGGTPSFYVELLKYDGTTFTTIANNSATPEGITGGTAIDLYITTLAVPATALALTDRLAVKIYVNTAGRTITLHTQNSHLCQIITTLTTGSSAFPITTASETLPIMGVISHSYGTNTVNKYEIITAAITDTSGTIVVKTQLSFSLSVGNVIQVYGLGSPYDGTWILTAVNQPAQPAYCYYTYVNPAAAGAAVPEFSVPVATAYAYVRSQVGNNSGYYGAGGIVWAMILSKRAFCVPQSYIYNYSGGTIVGGGDDAGLVLSVTRMLNRNPLPQYVYIDLGINDCTSTTITLAQMQSAVMTSIPQLINAGITPIMMAIRPVQSSYSGSLTPLQVNKKSKQYNKWLNTYCRQIGAVYVDSNYLSRDVAGSNNAVGGDVSTIYADFVHVNALGAKRDGLAIASVVSKVLPPNGSPVLTAADAFDATYNKTGSIAPLNSTYYPAGLFTATAAATALSGTVQTIGGLKISQYGAGTGNITAEVRATTATASDGLPLTGYEMVLRWPSGTTSPKNAYITLSAAAIAPSASTYTAGDSLQLEAEIYIPSASVTTGVTYNMPSISMQENFTGASQYLGSFLAGRTIVAANTQDVGFDGVMATPIFTTKSTSTGVNAILDVGIQSGTLTTEFQVIIRSISFRKVDPVYGEPF